jgi:two-component system cell cycle sensor histidine kinase/response regulator CckA
VKILIVDDDPAHRELLRLPLQSQNHEVVQASDGMEALKLLPDGNFDAMISDILMPNMDGYRLCFEARQTPRGRALPIILYSSRYLSPNEGDLPLRSGAIAFLEQPVSPERLEQVLREVTTQPAPVPATEPGDDLGVLKRYSERLITKIEEKNLELVRRTEELEVSEEKFRQLAENIQEVFFTTNTEFSQIHYVSPAYESVWGRPCTELYVNPRLWIDAIHPEDRESIVGLMKASCMTPVRFSWEYRIVRPDRSIRSIRARGFPIHDRAGRVYRFAGIAEDVTVRKSLELQLVQAQKMEAVGRLAGGVAHDFNNLLTAINGYSEIGLQRLNERDPVYQDITEILKAGERAAGLTRQLLAFSRKQVLQPRVIDLNTSVSDIERLLKRLIGEDIELVTSLGKDLGSVKADPGQVEQVLVNLAVNARDAMPNGGRLVLETANVELDDTCTQDYRDLRPGAYVMMAVTDNGTGMTDSVKDHLFEPFFTTKEPGKGTGLGLATVHGIVTQSGGYIGIKSELGRGTTFKVYLPRLDLPPEAVQKGGDRNVGMRGNETILLIEDEAVVRTLAKKVLTTAGYKVLEARRGEEALLIAENHQGLIHLALSDLIMPGMNGLELARRLCSIKVGLRTIFMSGYTDAGILNEGTLGFDTPFLSKPFTPNALLHKVREVLDMGRSTALETGDSEAHASRIIPGECQLGEPMLAPPQ